MHFCFSEGLGKFQSILLLGRGRRVPKIATVVLPAIHQHFDLQKLNSRGFGFGTRPFMGSHFGSSQQKNARKLQSNKQFLYAGVAKNDCVT